MQLVAPLQYTPWTALTLQLPVLVVEPHARLLHVNLIAGGAINARLLRTILNLHQHEDTEGR